MALSPQGQTHPDARTRPARWLWLTAAMPGPLSAAFVYAAYLLSHAPFDQHFPPAAAGKALHETLAIGLVSVAAGLLLARALVVRDRLVWLLAVGMALVWMREFHFDNTWFEEPAELLFTALWPATVIFGLVRGHYFRASPFWARARLWLLAAMLTYAWAMLGQRGFFKLLPGGDHLHMPLEEVGENTAHLLVAALAIALWLPLRRSPVDTAQSPESLSENNPAPLDETPPLPATI